MSLRLDHIPATEINERFLQGMVDRMGVSFHKYGPVAAGYPERLDAIASLKARLERYEETGNGEWLMDVANFAMIEFSHPRHPRAHFRATDSNESPGRVDARDGEATYLTNQDLNRLAGGRAACVNCD